MKIQLHPQEQKIKLVDFDVYNFTMPHCYYTHGAYGDEDNHFVAAIDDIKLHNIHLSPNNAFGTKYSGSLIIDYTSIDQNELTESFTAYDDVWFNQLEDIEIPVDGVYTAIVEKD